MAFRFHPSKRLALGCLFVLAGCGAESGVGPSSSQLQISPDTLTIEPRDSHQFYALGTTGLAIAAGNVTWASSGGAITAQGVFTADTSVRDYTISARDVSGHVASATVHTLRKAQQLVVVPATASVLPGGTLQFRSYGLTRSGDSVAAAATFVATGGGITPAGVYTAGNTLGTYLVIARAGSLVDTSKVTITATLPPAGPATVEVAPTSTTIQQSATYQFRATVRDASGNVLSGQAVTWSSANVSVASIDGSGIASGVSPGGTTITATSGGKAGTASITVQSPTSECSVPKTGWIWCDDFEQNRLSSYFEYDSAGGNFVRAAGVGYAGSTGMRAHWNTAQQSAGSLHLAMGQTPDPYFRAVDAGTANYREVYWRMYVRDQAGWTGGGGDKLSRAIVFANSNWSEAAIAHVWSGTSSGPNGNSLVIDPASGTDPSGNLLTTGYNDFTHLTWLGQGQTVTPIFDAAHVGQWYCVEAHAKLNTAGNSDGVFELWINGSLETQRTALNFLGSFSSYGINAVYFENYWNAGSVATQERYFDNIVVSTQRVGCL